MAAFPCLPTAFTDARNGVIPSVCLPSACVLPSTCLSHALSMVKTEGISKANILPAFMFRPDLVGSALFELHTPPGPVRRHQPGQLTGHHSRPRAPYPRGHSLLGPAPTPKRARYPSHHHGRIIAHGTALGVDPDPVLADGVHPIRYLCANIPGTVHGSGMAYAGRARARGPCTRRAIRPCHPHGAESRGRALGAVPCHRALSRAGAGTVLTSATWWPIHHPATGRERASVRRRWWLMLARSAIRAQARSRSPGERQRDRPPEGRHGTGERSEKERSDCPVIWGL